MYCIKCGKEIPDDANYCPKCGTPQKNDFINSMQSIPKYETCEITYRDENEKSGFSFMMKIAFFAKAIGPRGSRVAGVSETFHGEYDSLWHRWAPPRPSSKEAKRALDNLRSKLLADGWEPISKGHYYWEYSFRRIVENIETNGETLVDGMEENKALFNCPKCNLPFSTEVDLKKHISNWHKAS